MRLKYLSWFVCVALVGVGGCVHSGRYEVVRNPVSGQALADSKAVAEELCRLRPDRCSELAAWEAVVYLCEGRCRLVEFSMPDSVAMVPMDGGLRIRLHGGASGVVCDGKVVRPEWRESGYGCSDPLMRQP